MERARFQQFELTGQAQNAYSSSMPENTGEINVGSRDYQGQRTPEQVQAGIADWERYLQSRGGNINADTRDALRTMAQIGIVPSDNPNAEIRVPLKPQSPGLENVDLSQAENSMGGRRRDRSTTAENDLGMHLITPDSFNDPEMKRIAEIIQQTSADSSILRDPHLVDELQQKLNRRAMDPTVTEEARRLREHLEGIGRIIEKHSSEVEQGVQEMMRFSLTAEEMRKLKRDPFLWINEELDMINRLSEEGQELGSPRLSEAQRRQGMASKYLKTKNQDLKSNFLEKSGLLKNDEISIPLFKSFIERYENELMSVLKQEIVFDQSTNEIKRGDLVLSNILTSSEHNLLLYFLDNKDKILSRDEIINSVWKDLSSTEGVSEQALDQLIFRLRKKIEENPNSPKHIQTIKGRGFKFCS